MSAAERFIVSIEVEVEGTECGWNQEPIIAAARRAWDSPAPLSLRIVDDEARVERRANKT